MANEPSPTSTAIADIFANADPDRTSAATAGDRGMPPARLQDVAAIKTARNEQQRDLQALQRIVRETEAAAAKVDPDLVPGVRKDRLAQVRDQARQTAAQPLGRMRTRAASARAQAPLHSRDAVLLRAKFPGSAAEDSMQRLDWRQRLEGGSDSNLLEVARLGAATGNLPLLAVVAEAVRSRDLDLGTGLELETILGSVPVRASEEALAAIEAIEDLLAEGELEARTAATGWLDPADALEVALRSRRAGAGLRSA
jgi:hypothetical protein